MGIDGNDVNTEANAVSSFVSVHSLGDGFGCVAGIDPSVFKEKDFLRGELNSAYFVEETLLLLRGEGTKQEEGVSSGFGEVEEALHLDLKPRL